MASESGKSQPSRLSGAFLLKLAFILAALNGLVYTFLLPPWQHYDEPNHFEYIGLLTRSNRFPQPGDYDPALSQEIFASMQANGFYRDIPHPEIPPGGLRGVPGYPQTDDRPGYYLLAALPVYALGSASLETQLYAARLVSFLLFMVTILAAWGIATELTPAGHPLRWMVPLGLGLLPPFVDLMTAVNSDVGAIALFSLFLWGSARLIQRGFNLVDLAWALGAALAGAFTRSTAYPALVFLPLAVLFSTARGRLRPLVWGLAGLAVLGVLLGTVDWGDAAWWGRITFQPGATRRVDLQAPMGRYAFRIKASINPSRMAQINQLVALPPAESLKDKQVTVGAWIWSNRPAQVDMPVLVSLDGGQEYRFPVQVDQTPHFYAYTVTLQGTAKRNWIALRPFKVMPVQPTTVFYDGVMLVEGDWPKDASLQFDSADGQTGVWGGKPFRNLVRNASAEWGWFHLRSWVDRLGEKILPDKGLNYPSVILYVFTDLAATRSYVNTVVENLFGSFWGYFAWGHVRLAAMVYPLMKALSLAALVGGVLSVVRKRWALPWESIAFMGMLSLLVWSMALGRGAKYLFQLYRLWYPTARYGFIAIIPTILLFDLGWYEIGRLLSVKLHLPGLLLKAAYLFFWLGLNLYAIYTIGQYYH